MPHRCAAACPGAAARRAAPLRALPGRPPGQTVGHRPLPGRPGALVSACALTVLALTGCSMDVDMTIAAGGTYNAVLEMRDTTGTVLTSTGDCAALADPETLDVPSDAEVSAEPLSGGEDEVGCRVRITGVEIPQASQAQEGALVVRDADMYTVRMTAPDLGDAGSASELAPSQAPGATEDSLNEMVDMRVSVTFPGAVTEAGGGSVSGSTVTWEDTDALADGVTASGYAEQSRGVSLWSRAAPWVTAALVAAGAALGLAAAARHRLAPQPRRRKGHRRQQGRQGWRQRRKKR